MADVDVEVVKELNDRFVPALVEWMLSYFCFVGSCAQAELHFWIENHLRIVRVLTAVAHTGIEIGTIRVRRVSLHAGG